MEEEQEYDHDQELLLSTRTNYYTPQSGSLSARKLDLVTKQTKFKAFNKFSNSNNLVKKPKKHSTEGQPKIGSNPNILAIPKKSSRTESSTKPENLLKSQDTIGSHLKVSLDRSQKEEFSHRSLTEIIERDFHKGIKKSSKNHTNSTSSKRETKVVKFDSLENFKISYKTIRAFISDTKKEILLKKFVLKKSKTVELRKAMEVVSQNVNSSFIF
jgi:hypothetical protein